MRDESAARARRIGTIVRRLTDRLTQRRLAPKDGSRPKRKLMRRQERKRQSKPSAMIAYDLETTRIGQGTPRPLYITAYGEAPALSLRCAVRDMSHLAEIIVNRFLTAPLRGVRFVAWNGNNFDVFMIAAALLSVDGYTLRPYLTKSKSLRGLRVIVKGDEDLPAKQQRSWEFVDGISMLGLTGCSLEKFLKNFAPDHQKLTGVIDFEKEEFDANNPEHCEYAMRDSEGLYYGMVRAEEILLDRFNQSLAPTIGNACIKIFKRHIPEAVTIIEPAMPTLTAIRDYVMRGGFCYCVKRYRGPVWKYDLNQAYAAAMREAKLPCGGEFAHPGPPSALIDVYIAEVEASHAFNAIPFYYKGVVNGRVQSVFDNKRIERTWLTSIEIDQLRREGWRIKFHRTVFWDSTFSMTEYVNKLEHMRMNCEGGPNGAIGTMIKGVGNNSYGKTVERLEPIELVMAAEQPEGYAEYWCEGDPAYLGNIWFRITELGTRDYHQPQIGAFITAHVRMVVRRAALLAPDAWLYADTDCCMYSRDVSDKLDIHKSRYGAWKREESGAEYLLIAKKVYCSLDGKTKHCKGLNVKRLTVNDFEKWYRGEIPEQEQIQKQNFLKVMSGFEMFEKRVRKGTSL